MELPPSHPPTDEPQSPLKVLIEKHLKELNWESSDLAQAYGRIKEGKQDVDSDRYLPTITRVLKDPDACQFDAVKHCLMALDISLQGVTAANHIRQL